MTPPRVHAPIATPLAVALLSAALISAPATGGSTSPRLRPLEVTTDAELSFGILIVGSGGGSVRVDSRGGAAGRGAVHLRDAAQAGPARFSIRGEPDALFDLIVPESVELRDGAGSLRVHEIDSDIGFLGTLDGSGRAQVALGATLELPPRTATGSYSGTLTVILAYE